MFEIENLGNKELSECFFSLHLRVYHTFEIDGLSDDDYNGDPRKDFDKFYLSDHYFRKKNDLYLKKLDEAKGTFFALLIPIDELSEDNKYDLALYLLLRQEIINRGFEIDDPDLLFKMERTPTYVRESYSLGDRGDKPFDKLVFDDNLIMLDYPVRQACKILNEKGYITYWSSANISDFEDRKGLVVKDKNVAYILIDPANLTEDLKNELFLDGKCEFGGVAVSHGDDGKYYGIWAEITSANIRCDDLSKILIKKALALPELKMEKAVQQKK